MSVEPQCADLLRRLALNDEATVGSVFGAAISDDLPSALGYKTRALVRIAALIATEAAGASFQWAISSALSAGVEEDEVVGVLLSVAPVVGVARVAAAAPAIASALGYEVDLPDG
jgi:alkylhydroperoxidase/carboxymuconolactone decarboxylase family protein YurZ